MRVRAASVLLTAAVGAALIPFGGPASAAPVTTVRVVSVPKTAVAGTMFVVTGEVLVAGRPAVGQNIHLQYKQAASDDAWHNGTAVRTNANGKASFKVYAGGSTTLRFRHLAQGEDAAASSSTRTVDETRRITISTSKHTLGKGRRFTLSGTVTPDSAGKYLYLQRRSGSSWKTLRFTAVGRSSRYAFKERAADRGVHVYRVMIERDAMFQRSLSHGRTVRVT